MVVRSVIQSRYGRSDTTISDNTERRNGCETLGVSWHQQIITASITAARREAASARAAGRSVARSRDKSVTTSGWRWKCMAVDIVHSLLCQSILYSVR